MYLNEAKATIDTLKDFDGSADINDPSTTVAAEPVTVDLLRQLFGLSKNNEALNILHNIVTAALHLACAFKGTALTSGRLVSVILCHILHMLPSKS